MVRCVLFDLDGTLVHFDYDDFLNEYFKAITKSVAKMVDPTCFIKMLISSTESMIKNNDQKKSNKQVFMDDFFRKIDVSKEVLMPAFRHFYENEFTELKSILKIRPHPEARKMLNFLFEKGYDVVIATNAVFPIEAIIERMRWGGIDGLPYKLITCYETMHFCKPNIKYYEECLNLVGHKPSECLMVGNNVDEDMVAEVLGLKTYLVDDYLLDSGANKYKPNLVSNFNQFVEFVYGNGIKTL